MRPIKVNKSSPTIGSKIKDGYKVVRDDGVLTGIAVLLIGGILTYIANKLVPATVWSKAKAIINPILNWTKTEHSVYGWVLVLLGMITLMAGVLAYKEYQRRKELKARPDYLEYTTDTFYGLIWEWKWKTISSSRYHEPENLITLSKIPICPECSGNLKKSGTIFICINESCDWRYGFDHNDIDDFNFMEHVANKVLIKIRTKEHLKAIEENQ